MYLSHYVRIKNTLNISTVEDLIKNKAGVIHTMWVPDQSVRYPVNSESVSRKLTSLKTALYALAAEKPIDERYTEFKIPKASGGYRTLHAPDDELKNLQSKFADILIKDMRILSHNVVHSYTRKRNCKTAVQSHQQRHARWFLKIDVAKYFDHCNLENLEWVFDNVYPLKVHKTALLALTPMLLLNDSLPQGSPASPILSNLILLEFDKMFNESCKEKGFHYTRYADDLLISKNTSFKFSEVVDEITSLLGEQGFSINRRKIRYGSCNGSNWNLGLMYNKDLHVTVGHENKHLFKCRLHNLFRDQTDTNEKWCRERSTILGLYSYYSYIEPEYFKTKYETAINELRNISINGNMEESSNN